MNKPYITDELHKIISDKTSGSRELLSKLSIYLKNHSDEINNELISSLQKHFPDFQTIQNFLSDLGKATQNNSIKKFLTNYNDKIIFENIYKNLKPFVSDFHSFITISNSKTIFEVMKLIAGNKESIEVTVSEGRPNFEGRILAENLASVNIKTTLITEAQIFNAVQNCDCGIIGADKILKNGNVVNKVGSNLLASSCKEFNKPFLVIADKTKFAKDNSFNTKEMPGEEIYPGKNKEIKIDNYYFEEIPKKYITKIITD